MHSLNGVEFFAEGVAMLQSSYAKRAVVLLVMQAGMCVLNNK